MSIEKQENQENKKFIVKQYFNGWNSSYELVQKAMAVPECHELDSDYRDPEKTEIDKDYSYQVIVDASDATTALAQVLLTDDVFSSWLVERYCEGLMGSSICDPFNEVGQDLVQRYFNIRVVDRYIGKGKIPEGLTAPPNPDDDRELFFGPLTWPVVRQEFSKKELHRLEKYGERYTRYGYLDEAVSSFKFNWKVIDELKSEDCPLSTTDTQIIAFHILETVEEIEVTELH